MLRLFSDIKHLSLGATDGEIGTIKDAYFDDELWVLRYLVVMTGGWLSGRSVLITPLSIQETDWSDKRLEVALTREQIKNAPDADTDKPVSRQYEAAYLSYYGYPQYWPGPAWGGLAAAETMSLTTAEALAREDESRQRAERERADPHLRSANEIERYEIQAADGSIGRVKDLLFDDAHWSLRYFVVDTRSWLPGRKVLISTEWITNVSWHEREVAVAMSREEVRTSPEFDAQDLSQAQEQTLHRHYGRTPGEAPRIQIR